MLNTSSSVLHGINTSSFNFFNPYSFNEYPRPNAQLRICVLNNLLPVKYNIAAP